MLKNTTIIFLIIIAFSSGLYSQISKGDKYFEKAEYVKAIPYYKKVSRSNSDKKQEALIKLGNSYRLMNDYPNAEDSYRKALDLGTANLDAGVYYSYAQVLKANRKYPEAAEQYQNYIKLRPNDENAKKALKFVTEIKYYLARPIEYEVKDLEVINTNKAEFSPFVTNTNKLMFVAERESFDFVNYSVNEYNGEPYLNMYVSSIENSEVKKSKTYSRKLNTDYHDGPAAVSADGSTLYFTRVDYREKKGFVNNAKLFTATGSEKNWKNIHPIAELNSDDYSVAHPSISSDNNTLFFTSNMPGGYGGKDIYMSQRNGDTWGKPVNLGPDVNTSGDEMFPSLRKDGVLFFSSNGLPGFGGLDIYSAKNYDGKWVVLRNEGLDINSSADDFGITFLNDSVGYFSSNRAGGRGKDDIYWYRFRNRIVTIEGTVLLTENMKDYAKMKKVYLLDEKGNIVDSTLTDGKGYFSFKNLDSDKHYMAAVDDGDPEFNGKARFYLAEKDSVIHRVTTRIGKNKFAFKNLPVDASALPDLSTNDDLVLAGNLVYGDNKALKNTKLRLVSDKGDVMEETTTNEFGAFAFRNIPSDQNYMISIEESDVQLPSGTKVTLTNKSGKELKSFVTGKGKFSFKLLASDKTVINDMDAEDMNMVMDIYGYMYDQDKKPLVNTRIRVREDNGTGTQQLMTNEKGRFNFKNLSAGKNYIFETDEDDPSLTGVKRIYIADNKGKIYKIVDMNSGKFSFKILEVDKAALGEFVVDDPWLKVAEMKVKEKEKEKEKVDKEKTEKIAKAKEPKQKEPKQPKEPKEAKTPTEPQPKAEPQPKPEPEPDVDPSMIIVENIYYKYGDWHLLNDGEQILNKAVTVLKANKKLRMEISSHTDAQSSSGFNMRLSQKRAQTAVDYLVNHGISRARLSARGYGETRIINRCTEGVTCSDEEHRQNRRTEFKITSPTKKKK